MDRPEQDRAHLKGFDPSKSPRFQWRKTTPDDKPEDKSKTRMNRSETDTQ
jgi:hypothetical protein